MVKRVSPVEKVENFYLAEWRELKGLTQEQLAAALKTTKATVSRWENGERDPPLKAVKALCDALDISIPQMFTHPDFADGIDLQLSRLPRHQSQKIFEQFSNMLSGIRIVGKIGD